MLFFFEVYRFYLKRITLSNKLSQEKIYSLHTCLLHCIQIHFPLLFNRSNVSCSKLTWSVGEDIFFYTFDLLISQYILINCRSNQRHATGNISCPLKYVIDVSMRIMPLCVQVFVCMLSNRPYIDIGCKYHYSDNCTSSKFSDDTAILSHVSGVKILEFSNEQNKKNIKRTAGFTSEYLLQIFIEIRLQAISGKSISI